MLKYLIQMFHSLSDLSIRIMPLWGILCVSVTFTSCFDHRDTMESEVTPPRKPRPRPPFKDDPWFEKFIIEGQGMGLHAKLALSPGGQVSIAYWSTDGREGEPCDELMVDDPPLEVRWDLKFATWAEEEGWRPEQVAHPLLLGNPPGLDLDFQRSGKPVISSIGGEAIADLLYCGGGNLSLFTPSSSADAEEWDVEYVVERSDQAMSGAPASDFGYVVGYWPSQASSDNGARMVVYQDVHGGSLQRDDLVRADLEVALQNQPGGGWTHEVIDLGEGAGIYNQALITSSGERLVLYYISFDAQQAERQRQGLWLARRSANGEWERGLVFGGPTRGQPSLIEYGDGVAVAYYNPQARRPVVALLSDVSTLSDSGSWRRIPLGDLRYNEGHSPSLKALADGRLGVVWYRCGPAEIEECRPSDDAVVFSYPERLLTEEERMMGEDELEDVWKIEVVENGEEALCGFSPQLMIDRTKRAWVTWQCSRRAEVGGTFEYRLESARRELFETL